MAFNKPPPDASNNAPEINYAFLECNPYGNGFCLDIHFEDHSTLIVSTLYLWIHSQSYSTPRPGDWGTSTIPS